MSNTPKSASGGVPSDGAVSHGPQDRSREVAYALFSEHLDLDALKRAATELTCENDDVVADPMAIRPGQPPQQNTHPTTELRLAADRPALTPPKASLDPKAGVATLAVPSSARKPHRSSATTTPNPIAVLVLTGSLAALAFGAVQARWNGLSIDGTVSGMWSPETQSAPKNPDAETDRNLSNDAERRRLAALTVQQMIAAERRQKSARQSRIAAEGERRRLVEWEARRTLATERQQRTVQLAGLAADSERRKLVELEARRARAAKRRQETVVSTRIAAEGERRRLAELERRRARATASKQEAVFWSRIASEGERRRLLELNTQTAIATERRERNDQLARTATEAERRRLTAFNEQRVLAAARRQKIARQARLAEQGEQRRLAAFGARMTTTVDRQKQTPSLPAVEAETQPAIRVALPTQRPRRPTVAGNRNVPALMVRAETGARQLGALLKTPNSQKKKVLDNGFVLVGSIRRLDLKATWQQVAPRNSVADIHYRKLAKNWFALSWRDATNSHYILALANGPDVATLHIASPLRGRTKLSSAEQRAVGRIACATFFGNASLPCAQ